MQRFGLIVLFLAFLKQCSCENYVTVLPNCRIKVEGVTDVAKLYYDAQGSGEGLYTVNSQCYKCSKSMLADGLPSPLQTQQCATVSTPFDLYLRNSNGSYHGQRRYTFKDSAEYLITRELDGSIGVEEIGSPFDTYRPLYIFLSVLVAVTVLAFILHPILKKLYEWVKEEDAFVDEALSKLLPDENERDPNVLGKTQSDVTTAKKKPARLQSLDAFRGFALTLMIFVNYGGGDYYFFNHVDWNGLTVADLVFPWFMWMMGVSMALSFSNLLPKNVTKLDDEAVKPKKYVEFKVWIHVFRRSIILFGLGLFLNNGFNYDKWRIPGVLQYFAVSYFLVSVTVLALFPLTQSKLQQLFNEENMTLSEPSNPRYDLMAWFDSKTYSKILFGYCYEWSIQLIILVGFLSTHLGAKAPGCPRGYLGPGGVSEDSAHWDCTGGIHRWLDVQIFGEDHFYAFPTCQKLYSCIAYDPEGFLGMLSATTLTYIGLMTGRVILHFPDPKRRLAIWAMWSFVLLLIGGALCGFSQENGLIPVNKNLWSTSFVLIAAGGGLIGLGVCYILIDIKKWWSGTPFLQIGMNSILFYCLHETFEEYMPFQYKIDADNVDHATRLQSDVIGVSAWLVIAYYCYKIKFFIKI